MSKKMGDWAICELPDPEYFEIVRKRLREFKAKQTTQFVQRGYHNSVRPNADYYPEIVEVVK